MTRKEKIQLLQMVANGKSVTEIFGEATAPMVIDTDGTEIDTGRPPTPERIEQYKNGRLPAIFFIKEATPDWAEVYGFRKRKQPTPEEIDTAIRILTDEID